MSPRQRESQLWEAAVGLARKLMRTSEPEGSGLALPEAPYPAAHPLSNHNWELAFPGHPRAPTNPVTFSSGMEKRLIAKLLCACVYVHACPCTVCILSAVYIWVPSCAVPRGVNDSLHEEVSVKDLVKPQEGN